MYTLITTLSELNAMSKAMSSRSKTPLAFDIETTGLDFQADKIITLQFMQFGYQPVIADVRKWTPETWQQATPSLHRLFRACETVGMNLTFDLKFVQRATGLVMRKVYDVMLVEQVIRGLGKSGGKAAGVSFDLKSIAGQYGQEVSKEVRSSFVEMHKRPEWHQPFSNELLEYMAQDVAVLEPIYQQQTQLLKERKLVNAARLENRCLPAVASVEFNGIHVDADKWRAFIQTKEGLANELEIKAVEKIGEIVAVNRARKFRQLDRQYRDWLSAKKYQEQEVKDSFAAGSVASGWGTFKRDQMKSWRNEHPNPGRPKLETHLTPIEAEDLYYELAEAGRLTYSPINLSSPSQLLEALQALGVNVSSTSKDALAEIPDGEHEAVDLLKAFRTAKTFPTKFGDTVLSLINPISGRLHPSYIQIGADTGRMSCSRPAWQQVPSRGDGAKLRSFVLAEPGNVLLTADYSTIELRILADMSGDKTMIAAFASGVDLHSYTARMMFNLLDDVDVKNEQAPGTNTTFRNIAKTINFGLVYGMSASRLARTLKIKKDQAEDLMSRYFEMYPGVTSWLARQRKLGVETLESRTVCGRVRYYNLPGRHTREYKQQKSAVERKACNSPIQGSSADITKLALAWVYDRILDRGWQNKARIVAVVHDEIVVEVNKELANDMSDLLGCTMQEACKFFLKQVAIPPTEVIVSDRWEKA